MSSWNPVQSPAKWDEVGTSSCLPLLLRKTGGSPHPCRTATQPPTRTSPLQTPGQRCRSISAPHERAQSAGFSLVGGSCKRQSQACTRFSRRLICAVFK
eukprot:s1756_g20.t1